MTDAEFRSYQAFSRDDKCDQAVGILNVAFMRAYLPTYPEIYASARNAPPGKERLNYADWKLYAAKEFPAYKYCELSREMRALETRLAHRKQKGLDFHYSLVRNNFGLSERKTRENDRIERYRNGVIAELIRMASEGHPPAILHVLELHRRRVVALTDEGLYFLLLRLCRAHLCDAERRREKGALKSKAHFDDDAIWERYSGNDGGVLFLCAMPQVTCLEPTEIGRRR